MDLPIAGTSIPSEAMMHLPPVSDSPTLFPKMFTDSVENFPNFTFSEKISDFHPPKFQMTCFTHRLQICYFLPIFAVSVHFSIISEKFVFPPTFANLSLIS